MLATSPRKDGEKVDAPDGTPPALAVKASNKAHPADRTESEHADRRCSEQGVSDAPSERQQESRRREGRESEE